MLKFEKKHDNYRAFAAWVDFKVCKFNDRTWGLSAFNTMKDEWLTKGIAGYTENYSTRAECYARAEEIAKAQMADVQRWFFSTSPALRSRPQPSK